MEQQLTFNADQHKYYLGNKELISVTTLLSSTIFQNKYAGVSEKVLQAKAEEGQQIHAEIEVFFETGIYPSSADAKAGIECLEQCGINIQHTELRVNDSKVAGTIDLVTDAHSIIDIKHTYNFDHEYVSWQTSIYAYLYEKKYNVTVYQVYGLHLHGGTAKMYPVERKPNQEVEKLINSYFFGEDYQAAIPDYIQSIEEELYNNQQEIDRLTERNNELREQILTNMAANNCKTIKTNYATYTRKDSGTRVTFDSKAFKAKHADLYEQFTKVSETKQQLTIKFL